MITKIKVAKDDIETGQAKSYQCEDDSVVVCNLGGNYYALSNICTHAEGELVAGEGRLVEACQLECPLHGARFDVRTGEAKRMPAVAPLKTYKIVEKGNELEVLIE